MSYKNLDFKKLVVIDIETLKNCIIFCCRDYHTGSKKEFVFFNDKKYENQPLEFFKFLRSLQEHKFGVISFNGVGFDMQILHYYYDWCCEKQDPLYALDIDYIISNIYNKAQEIISLQDNMEERFKHLIPEKDLFMPTIDLFLQLHYNRPAKATSLKWVEFSMQYPTIQDMPINHDEDLTIDDVPTVIEYCWNDVDATCEFFNKVKFETETRLELSNEFKLNLINASEPKLVREIFGKFISKEMGITYGELKKLKTIRKDVKFKDIILPYVKFQTEPFKEVLKAFTDKVLDCNPHSTDKFKHTMLFQNMDIELGLGGIHSCISSGVYSPKENEVIEDADGTSFYPMLAIKNGLRPEHLGQAFNVVYPMMFDKRQQYDKKDPRNYLYKIILNSAYGLSKEINSYLYDPKFTYSITLNGQLSLLMLVEALYMSVPNIKFLQMNTDGITYVYDKQYTEKVRKICKWWENTTKINLEYAYYNKMVINDVNNYMAIYTDGKVKKKGLFETSMPYHKNPSALIIPKALEEYFINNISPDVYIKKQDNNIYDYCLAVKKKSNFKLNLVKNFGHAEILEEQQKVCRYIVAKQNENTGLLVKDFNDGRRVSVEANTLVEPLYVIKPECPTVDRYNINYDYYIKGANKIISAIDPPVIQQTLF
jgi:hypothetical protein